MNKSQHYGLTFCYADQKSKTQASI